MDLDTFAEYFMKYIPDLNCPIYDHPGFGASDTAPNAPHQKVLPYEQYSDLSDAITYAQSLPSINASKIGIWGSSYSGGHFLWFGSIDRRVKAVLCQAPCVDGWANFHCVTRPDFIVSLSATFQAHRLARAAGREPGRLPVVDENPMAPSALPIADGYKSFKWWEDKCPGKNEVTVRSIEAFRVYNPAANTDRISPTPLLMTVGIDDVLTSTDLAMTRS